MEHIILTGLGLNLGEVFQESLAKNLQDTEDDQYLGRQGDSPTKVASGLRSRSVVKGAHTRIQAPDPGALQMLLIATKGDQNKKEVWMSTEIGRCFSSVPAVRDCACYNSP